MGRALEGGWMVREDENGDHAKPTEPFLVPTQFVSEVVPTLGKGVVTLTFLDEVQTPAAETRVVDRKALTKQAAHALYLALGRLFHGQN